MRKILTVTFLLFLGTVCFGQSTFKGLTPGKSTTAEVGQVLGLPARNLSQTLAEFKFAEAGGKAYVQYRDNSSGAVVERLELTCERVSAWEGKCNEAMRGLEQEYVAGNVRNTLWPDAMVRSPQMTKNVLYYGEPRFVVITFIDRPDGFAERRVAFYSAELYEAARPKGGCTGSIFGEWETNRGRMLIERVGNLGFKGTFSENNGIFTGRYDDKAIIRRSGAWKREIGFSILAASFEAQQRSQGAFVGEWKDSTGTGTMSIPFELTQTTFSGAWGRTSGAGPGGGAWEGRCVG